MSPELSEVKKDRCAICGNYHLKGEDCPNTQPPIIEFKAAKAEKCVKCGKYHMKGEDCPDE